jgi:hypothetical protein
LADLRCEFLKHPAQTTVSFLTSREESFRALGGHIGCGRVICSTTKTIGWMG